MFITPLVGAFLADAYCGRFWVILVAAFIYLLGLVGILAVNVLPGLKPAYMAGPPPSATLGVFWCVVCRFVVLLFCCVLFERHARRAQHIHPSKQKKGQACT